MLKLKEEWLRKARGNQGYSWLLMLILVSLPLSLMAKKAHAQAPGQVRNPTATFLSCGVGSVGATVRLTWDPPTMAPTAPAITGYRPKVMVYLTSGGSISGQTLKSRGVTQTQQVVGTSTDLTVYDLTTSNLGRSADTLYTPKQIRDNTRGFWIEAHNSAGRSPGTFDATFDPLASAEIRPDNVSNITGIHYGDSVVVTWDETTGSTWKLAGIAGDDSEVDANANRYGLQKRRRFKEGSNTTWTQGSSSSIPSHYSSTNKFVDTDVSPDSTYQYRIKALSNCRKASADWSQTASIHPKLPPDTPAILGTPTMNETSAELKINHGLSSGATPTSWTGLNVYYRKASGSFPVLGNPSVRFSAIATDSLYTVDNLEPATSYFFKVTTTNTDNLESAFSDSVAGTTTSLNVNKPQSAPEPVTLTPSGTSVQIAWTPLTTNFGTGATAISSYQVQGRRSRLAPAFPDYASATGAEDWKTSSSGSSTTHSSLSGGSTWWYRVRAVNDQGLAGPWSGPKSVTLAGGAPGTPTLSTSVVSQSQIDISWTAPSVGASAISAYELQQASGTLSGNDSDFSTIYEGLNLSFSNTSLTASTFYHYRVRAKNSNGNGSWSTTIRARTLNPGTSIIPPPTNLQATRGETNIVLTWRASTDTDVTGYQIDVEVGGSRRILVDNTGSTTTTYTHPNTSASTTYTYWVAAIKGTEKSAFSAPVIVRSTQENVPGPPTLQASSDTSEVTLSWTKPINNGGFGIIGYRIEFSLNNGASWSLLAEVDNSTFAYTDDEIADSQTRHYRIFAENRNGLGESSNIVSARLNVELPSEPRDLQGAPVSGGVRLTWLEPTDNGGGTISAYRIEMSATGSTWELVTSSATGLEHTITGLPASVTRHFRVAATNEAGTGPWSRTVQVTTGTSFNAPTNLEAVRDSDGETIRLSWSSSSGATGYRIDVKIDGVHQVLIEDTETTATTYRHTGTSSTSRYEYTVAAIGAGGILSPFSLPAVVPAVGKLGAPELRALSGKNSIQLRWTKPEGSTEITGFTLEVSENGGQSWSLLADLAAGVYAYSHDELGPGATRTYRIFALNVNGPGPSSNVVTATTDVQRPTRARDLQARANSSGVQLTWLEPENIGGGRIQRYRIEISTNSQQWELVTDNAQDLSYQVTGLPPDVPRYFRVAAFNEAGMSPWSNTARVQTRAVVPDAPTGLKATPWSSSQILVTWSEPKFKGGETTSIQGYRLEWHSGGDWKILIANTNSLTRSYAHTGLEPGTEYFYRVFAINKAGISPPSDAASARTDPIVSEKPLRLTVQAEGSDRLRLRWLPPAYDGGGAITGYRIEAQKDGIWQVVESDTRSTQTDYLHMGLKPAETWTYRVIAINAAGLSPPSDPISGTTDPVLPDAPYGLRAKADGSSAIELSWFAPVYTGGGKLTGYAIEFSSDRSTWNVLVGNTNNLETSYRHEGIPPGSKRHYRVFAINKAGRGPPSLEASAVTKSVEPDPPENTNAEAIDHETIRLTWRAPNSDGGSPIQGYTVELWKESIREWQLLSYKQEELEYIHRDLEPATVYQYRVLAMNEIGTSKASQTVTGRTKARVPDPPENLTAEAVLPTQVDLDWDPPKYDGGAELNGYSVEATRDPEVGWTEIGKPKASQFSHENLKPGQTWYYRVRALNTAGFSNYSNIAEATTDDTEDRIARLNEGILPRFALTIASGIVESVSKRLDAIVHNRSHHASMPSLQAFEDSTGFLGLFNGASASRSLSSRMSAWGNIERTNMDAGTSGGDLDWSGNILTFHTGSDMMIKEGLYVGVAGSYSSGDYLMIDHAWDSEIEGEYRVGMTSLTPYVGWLPSDKIVTWAAGSYSFGNITVSEGLRGTLTSKASMKTGAMGLIGNLTSSQFGGVKLKIEGWSSELEVKADEGFRAMDMTLRRVRTVLEWSRVNRMETGHEFSILINGGLRHDFNEDQQNHSGFEIGGGLGYSSPNRRMRLTMTGRTLVTTDADYSEWGLSGGLYIDPSADGGLAAKVEPGYGPFQSGVESLWNQGVRSLNPDREFRVPILIEYKNNGALTPYVRYSEGKPFFGMNFSFVSLEGTGGDEPGFGIQGQWSH